ncbi:MAG: putative baseplate assembly protein [Actinomycetota bacterium]|nr:putative baseplate assembly protein [Actinomycetota bacterium]
MSAGCEPIIESPCGCCTGLRRETPEAIANRPALSSIAYRVGRYGTFDPSMLAALSDPAFPALGLLRTRDANDLSMALLDAWAVALDILTFYQERFANEAFLRTAVDQRSVFELAALVGYQPSPGVAASAALAFTLASAPGAPDNVLIPTGTRVQSIPGPGQTAQVFETSSDITARIGWNALPAQTKVPWQLSAGDSSTWIDGVANHLAVGDGVLFVSDAATEFHYLTAITPYPQAGNTLIAWDQPLSSPLVPSAPGGADSSKLSLYAFGKKAGLYGAQAPNPQTLSGAGITSVPGYPKPLRNAWDYTKLYTDYSYQIHLDGVYPGLAPPPSGPPQWIVLTGTEHEYTSVFQIEHAADTNPGYFTLISKTTRLTLQLVEILSGDQNLSANEVIYAFIKETPEITAYIYSAELTASAPPLSSWALDSAYLRRPGMNAPVAGSQVAIIGGQEIGAGQPIGITGKRLRLQVPLDQTATFSFVPSGTVTGAAAAPGQVFIVDAFPPESDAASPGKVLWSVETLSGVSGKLSAPGAAGAIVLLPAKPGPKGDPDVTEAATVQSVTVNGDITVLTLKAPLARIYDATEVKVNANAVEATHGETVQEILGSGDATNAALQFTLKQGPLTYLTATSETGSRSTLEVWVNNLRWSEVANLLERGPADRAFVTRADTSGHRVITFGNGLEGARTPTGTANLRALYRKGIGIAGMVKAGQLSQPLTRPQGVTGVINPGDASGAADPASADQARASAPLPTLTIGRVVSLEDYQNFALAFSGIAKAWATWTWFGDIRGVFLTVAGENGATLTADDPILASLISSIRLYSEPYVPLRVASFQPVQFTFSAGVAVNEPEYSADLVLAQVWQSVSDAFAFDRRQLGQGVAASEIIELVQQVPGVVAVQLQSLEPSGDPAQTPPPTRLCASGPRPPQGAQLLELDRTTAGRIGPWST